MDNFNSSTTMCYRATMTGASGIFLGGKPLHTSLPNPLAQITIIYIATRISHTLLSPLDVPQIVSHIIAGVILGPTFLSQNEAFRDFIFPERGWVILNLLGHLSFTIFIFATSLKTELGLIYNFGVKLMVLAAVTFFLPFITILITNNILKGKMVYKLMTLFFYVQWSLTSNTVVAILLVEFNLLTSKLGRLESGLALGGMNIIATCVFFLVAIIDIRHMTSGFVDNTADPEATDDAYMLLIVMSMALTLLGELMGQQYTFVGTSKLDH